jgi:hypothetical protein
MKRATFIGLFISVHLVFVIAQIHKHSQIVKLSYQKQNFEKRRNDLVEKQHSLTHQLYAQKNLGAIKEFAIKNLHMAPVKLSQIKRLHGER